MSVEWRMENLQVQRLLMLSRPESLRIEECNEIELYHIGKINHLQLPCPISRRELPAVSPISLFENGGNYRELRSLASTVISQ